MLYIYPRLLSAKTMLFRLIFVWFFQRFLIRSYELFSASHVLVKHIF